MWVTQLTTVLAGTTPHHAEQQHLPTRVSLLPWPAAEGLQIVCIGNSSNAGSIRIDLTLQLVLQETSLLVTVPRDILETCLRHQS
jgi:hypothetical protein